MQAGLLDRPLSETNSPFQEILERLGAALLEENAFSKDVFPFKKFLNRSWFLRQFEIDRESGEPKWRNGVRELIHSQMAYSRAYWRRRLALCLAGSVVFEKRDFPSNFQASLYAGTSGVQLAEEIFSGIAAEAGFILTFLKRLSRRGYGLLVGNPSLDLAGIDFLVSGAVGVFALDIKGNRGKTQVGFKFSHADNRRIGGEITVIEITIPMLVVDSNHRGALCVSFPFPEAVKKDIVNGLSWMLTQGREGRCLFPLIDRR